MMTNRRLPALPAPHHSSRTHRHRHRHTLRFQFYSLCPVLLLIFSLIHFLLFHSSLFYIFSLIFIHFGFFLCSLFSVSHSTPARRLSPPPHVDVSWSVCARSAICQSDVPTLEILSVVIFFSSSIFFLLSHTYFSFFFRFRVRLLLFLLLPSPHAHTDTPTHTSVSVFFALPRSLTYLLLNSLTSFSFYARFLLHFLLLPPSHAHTVLLLLLLLKDAHTHTLILFFCSAPLSAFQQHRLFV